MFSVGDLVIYSGQGICKIDEICDKTFLDVTREYYILHPIENPRLKISVPVDNDDVLMKSLINKDEAEEIMESFKLPGMDWIEIPNHRLQVYNSIVKKGKRKEISMIVNTLMRKKIELENNGRKFDERDKKLLISIQDILFSELAHTLDTTTEAINERINSIINENK